MKGYKRLKAESKLLRELLKQIEELSKVDYFKLLKKYVDEYKVKLWEIQNEDEEDKPENK